MINAAKKLDPRKTNWRVSPDFPTLFEQSVPGRRGTDPLTMDVPKIDPSKVLPAFARRAQPAMLPELSEPEVIRHYTRLSTLNYAIDLGIYPLGSCTMKYNPKINEEVARFPGFMSAHPYDPPELLQGVLKLMYDLQGYLADVSGMAAVTLHPAAGAQGELCGLLLIREALRARGDMRKKVIVPDSAHGTNPATAALVGYETIKVETGPNGVVELAAVEKLMDQDVAAIMITNPNTLGIFEHNIKQICDLVHSRGGFVYLDGANLNALAGVARPGDFGADVMHINVHKTFSQPHGGGGPGAGPVCCVKELEPFLPSPVVVKKGEGKTATYDLDYNRPKTIGKLRSFATSFLVMVRTYTYIRSLGAEGVKKNTEMAVLNARYLRSLLEGTYNLPYKTETLHEVVFDDKFQKVNDVTTLDIAKRLVDYGVHPPTVYFPLVIPGALMMEPTESESKATIEEFAQMMIQIAEEAKTEPQTLRDAPTLAPRRRFDEAAAARKPVLRAPTRAL